MDVLIGSRFMEDGSLASILTQCGKFPEEIVAGYMYQIIGALAYLHSKGFMHRDIKGFYNVIFIEKINRSQHVDRF